MRESSASTVISAFTPRTESRVPSRSIGAILVDAGRMSAEQTEAVLRYQRQHAMPFGDAAVKLAVVTPADIEYALAQQFEYPYLIDSQSPVSRTIIAAYEPFSPQVEALRSLRTQLLLRLFGSDRKHGRLAITSADPGDGRSYLAANLAVVFSQLGEKTLLIDADMRSPTQHTLFGLDTRAGLSSVLSGRSGLEAIQRVPSMIDLSLLASGPKPPNPQELLGRPIFTQLLDEVSIDYDVVIIDTPPGSQHSEALTVASRAGAALLVARKDYSRVSGLQDMTQSMSQARITVVGAVLNDF
ncbi:MAG: chain length determinant protein tyrosine kinase EpsG [Burkholderiaceae bacterium]